MAFKKQRDKLMSLFERMDKYRNYQCERVDLTKEDPLTSKLFTGCEIDQERLIRVQSIEEVKDMSEQFHAYYSEDIPLMRIQEKILEYREEQKSNPSNVDEEQKEFDDEELTQKIRNQLNIKVNPLLKTDYYSVCKQANFEGLVKKFGLKPEKFGENLSEKYQKNEIDQYPIGPLATCEEFVCKQFPSPDTVLQVKFKKKRSSMIWTIAVVF